MPGEVVAHNADEMARAESADSFEVRWEFGGGAYRDRQHELVVVSRVQSEIAEK